MAAFVSFVSTYAVWIYLLLAFGILFAIKMLVDARRLSRATLFSLEQERAAEQVYRALILAVILLMTIMVVTAINVWLAPNAPPAESPILRGPTATLAPFVIPTNSPVPTLTPTLVRVTETPFSVGTPIGATATSTRAIRPTAPLAVASATPVYAMAPPVIVGPIPNGGTWIGEGQANAAMTFRWNCEKCALGANDWFEVVISFTDRAGAPRTFAGRTQERFLALKRIYEGGGFELYQKAKEDTFYWFVQVKRESGNVPLSAPSDTWKFVWK